MPTGSDEDVLRMIIGTLREVRNLHGAQDYFVLRNAMREVGLLSPMTSRLDVPEEVGICREIFLSRYSGRRVSSCINVMGRKRTTFCGEKSR